MTRILRTSIPVGPIVQAHIGYTDDIHVDARELGELDVWWEDRGRPTIEPPARTFVVVDTGHEWPEGRWERRGTALSPATAQTRRGELVWHLLELIP